LVSGGGWRVPARESLREVVVREVVLRVEGDGTLQLFARLGAAVLSQAQHA
jgi:hypothetical protein